jgi:NifU-like protein involved in Fe-S cluster formation
VQSHLRDKVHAVLDDVYNQKILALAADVPRLGRLGDAEGSATLRSKLCGSTVTVDVRIDGDQVIDFAHEVKACALGQASSSIMARHVVGASRDELLQVRDGVLRMLKEGAPPPEIAGWPELALLEPVRDFKARHASTMLTFDAVLEAFDKARNNPREASAA